MGFEQLLIASYIRSFGQLFGPNRPINERQCFLLRKVVQNLEVIKSFKAIRYKKTEGKIPWPIRANTNEPLVI